MEFIGIPRHKLTAMPHEFGRLISGSAQQRVTAEEPASPSVTERVAEGGQFLVDGAIAPSVLRVLNAPVTVSVATGIKESPCMEMLRLALEKIAQERSGASTQGYHDCNDRFHPCLFGIKTTDLPKGIGVNVSVEGRVVLQFDQSYSADSLPVP